MKENGFATKPKEKEHFGTLKETSMSVSSKLIKQMATESTLMSMVPSTRENGLMMFKRDKVKRFGSMEQCMLENTKVE